MKKRIQLALAAIVIMVSSPIKAQEICMVTADFDTGTKYVIYWEQFVDISNIDSVYIYRRQGVESVFTKVGGVDVGIEESTFFVDESANTMDTTKYAIATLDNLGNVSNFSPWHQAVVYDYSPNGNGFWTWTPYKKENQLDVSYIGGYECLLDLSGTGAYTSIGQVSNTQLFWTDVNFGSNAEGYYVIQAELPLCQFVERADINTSRSNIKQQYTNAEAGVSENFLQGVSFEISPNPSTQEITIDFGEELVNAKMAINNSTGEQVLVVNVSGTQTTLKVDQWATGVYFLNVYSKGVVTTKKFIKN